MYNTLFLYCFIYERVAGQGLTFDRAFDHMLKTHEPPSFDDSMGHGLFGGYKVRMVLGGRGCGRMHAHMHTTTFPIIMRWFLIQIA